MRSVVVVLPASMWAMIPMFRVRTSGYSRITRGCFAPPGARPASFAACAMSSFNSPAGTAMTNGPPRRTPGPQRARPRDSLSWSPSVMGESLVGVGHLVHVLTSLDGGALPVGCVHDLADQAVGHGMLTALPRVVHQPPQGQRCSPMRPDFDRHLIGRAADPARPGLEQRPGV